MRVVITGGASGIGRASAAELRERGAEVVILDRDGERADFEVDVRDPAATVAAVEAAAEKLGGIDGLVTCAGTAIREPALEISPENWSEMMKIHAAGTFFAIQAAARQMIAAGEGGAVVTISSTAANGYIRGMGTHYHAAKAAIAGMSRALSAELSEHRIRVNSVAPGPVPTAMTAGLEEILTPEQMARRIPPLGRLIEPEEVAATVAFLLSPAAAMISGETLVIDGAQHAFL